MSPLNYARLSLMMFVQFFLWGAWYVTGPLYLGQAQVGFTGDDFGWMYSVGPIAGMISPFFVGMIADRFFSTERVLGVMHLLGAAAMFAATAVMIAPLPPALAAWRPPLVNLLFFAHMLCYFPTLSLTNTLAMHTMTDSEKQFPLIRVFGTIGWIAGNNVLTVFGWQSSINMFYLAAASGIVMGVYSFFLPHTPPPSAGKAISAREILGLDALVLLKKPSYLAFMVSSFLICIPLSFYYILASRTVTQGGFASAPATIMSLGQVSEIFFMLVMPLCFAALGVKWMLFVGMLAWVARYGLFTLGAPEPSVPWMVLTGVLLHGICYDFFFVTGQIYTDQVAPGSIRGQAQGMLVLFTLGLGMLIGAKIAGTVETACTPKETAWLSAEAGAVGTAAGDVGKKLDELLAGASPEQRKEFDNFRKQASATWLDQVKGAFAEADKETNDFIAHADAETKEEQEKISAVQQEVEKLKEKKSAESELKSTTDQLADLRKTKAEKIAKLAESRATDRYNDLANGPASKDAYVLWQTKNLLSAYQGAKSVRSLQVMNWKTIWMIPAIFAGVIMVLFVFVFREEKREGKEEKGNTNKH